MTTHSHVICDLCGAHVHEGDAAPVSTELPDGSFLEFVCVACATRVDDEGRFTAIQQYAQVLLSPGLVSPEETSIGDWLARLDRGVLLEPDPDSEEDETRIDVTVGYFGLHPSHTVETLLDALREEAIFAGEMEDDDDDHDDDRASAVYLAESGHPDGEVARGLGRR